ncbi:MAG: RAD55 family ATPase [Nanoarchaeota archaeon]
MVGILTERCPTGIAGLDQISQGGFVRNSVNVIIGGPGSGKTTFMLQFLHNGSTKYDENGLYCSFEPDIIETLKDAMAFGWDFSVLNERDKVKFLKFSPQTSIDELKSELTRLIAKYNIKRVCFDPISVLALAINDEGKRREMIFDLISLMKRLKVTSVIADEFIDEDSDSLSKVDVLRFLTDSVTLFYNSNLAIEGDRSLKIAKMRRTNHVRDFVGMNISYQGMQILTRNLINQNMQNQQARFNQSNQIQQSPNLPSQNLPVEPPAVFQPKQLPPLPPLNKEISKTN